MKIEDITKVSQNSQPTNTNLYSNSENEHSKVTIFSNEAIMNSTNKHFELIPQEIKKENLVNVSGVNKGVNFYDFPSNSNIPISFEILFSYFPGYETAKSSKKQVSNLIKAYAANTYQGIIRYKVNNLFLLEITTKIEYQ